jgi:hypothetical protein
VSSRLSGAAIDDRAAVSDYGASMGMFPVVERIASIETLTEAQRELLDELLETESLGADPDRVIAEIPSGAELVVYRLNDGKALVAPQAEGVTIGAPIMVVGWERIASRVALSEGDLLDEVELSLAAGIQTASVPE